MLAGGSRYAIVLGMRLPAPFRRPRALLPVIHTPLGEAGALQAIRVAVDAGADGVFLIDQGMSAQQVLALLPRVRQAFPDLWVGLNLLGWDPGDVIRDPLGRTADGLWADDAGVDALDEARASAAEAAWRQAVAETGWRGLYFGGTAFKTQAPVPAERLPWVAERAARFVDVPTTSGPGTGLAADPAKIRALRAALGDRPMAVASGVTPDNVGPLLPHVDAYLVATGIEARFGVLDPVRTEALAKRLRSSVPDPD
jgi:hypothetical protein